MKSYLLCLLPIVFFLACEDKEDAPLPSDCAGVENGTAEMDNCGNCIGGNTGEIACTQDCADDWGGTAIEDCNSECGGTAFENECGYCVEGNTGLDEDYCIVTDIDGNEYEIVKFGVQLWTAENLKVTHYNNGDEISTYNNDDWSSLASGAYGVHNNDPSNEAIWGNLYNWYAVDDDRGICPESWHVPTDDEFKQLEMFLGMSEEDANSPSNTGTRGTDEGSKLAGNAELWIGDSWGSETVLENNSVFGTSGFDGLPGGSRDGSFNGGYGSVGFYCYFWTSTKIDSTLEFPWNDYAWDRDLYDFTSEVLRRWFDKKNGFSVRCVKD